MSPADSQILQLLEPYMTSLGYAVVVSEVNKAGGIRNLQDSVALTELIVAKKKFGSRSAASQYAANIRWAGRKPEMRTADIAGNLYRTSKVDGVDTQFSVKPASAGSIAEGDIVSVGSHRIPTKVESVKPSGDKLVVVSRDLNTGDKVETTISPNATIRKWTPESSAPQKGALNTSRAVDSSKITSAEVRFINEGKSGPDRVRRANEVMDRYASSGKDVSKPQGTRGRGGAQWLETGQ